MPLSLRTLALLSLSLGLSTGCTRFGFDPSASLDASPAFDSVDASMGDVRDASMGDVRDASMGDVRDASWADIQDAPGDDAGACDGSGLPTLVLSPSTIEDLWVERGTTRSYRVAAALVGGCRVPSLKFGSAQAWISTSNFTKPSPRLVIFDIGVDARALTVGNIQAKVTVSSASPGIPLVPKTITLNLRVLNLKQVHVGMKAGSCPHAMPAGGMTKACDFVGANGLREAVAASGTGAHIYLHDSAGQRASYDGDVDLKQQTWLSAAKTSDPAEVHVIWPTHDLTGKDGVLRLAADDCHVSRLTVISRPGCNFPLTSWRTKGDPTSATAGHLIENVRFLTWAPEISGNNSIFGVTELGSETTLRNCLFQGFIELRMQLDKTHHTRLIQNTFVSFQQFSYNIEVRGSQDLVIANNVFVTNTQVRDHLVIADAATARLTLAGNVVEGVDKLVVGLTGTSHRVRDNVVGQAQLESPFRPFFLTNTTQRASDAVPGEGISLDEHAVLTGPSRLPGAFQKKSALTTRRMLVRVGTGSCGTHACDFTPAADNAIQQAVWSVWRGGRVEVYPSSSAYAGDAVIPWGITLRGMGAQPDDVVLQSQEEIAPVGYDLWRHRAVIVVLEWLDAPVTLENLTVDVVSGAQTNERALMIESDPKSPRKAMHVLSRIRALAKTAASGPSEGIVLASKTLVQDVLIQGAFGACLRYGSRRRSTLPTRQALGSRVVNLTCRLTGTGAQAPRAAFEVASVKDALLINVAVDLSDKAPLFRAQRRSVNDSATLAKDHPLSFSIHAASIRNASPNFDGFRGSSGSYTLSAVDTVAAAAPFFVSATDSHLASGAQALDRGVDPSILDSTLQVSTSLDGVSRQGKKIDRGAYEQGL